MLSFLILFLGITTAVYYPPVIFLDLTIYDYTNNPAQIGNRECAYDFPRRHTSDGWTKNCVQNRLTERDASNQKVPTPTHASNCPRDINQWFIGNEITRNVTVKLMATQISINPPLYKFQETGTPGFSPLKCTYGPDHEREYDGFGCTTSSGYSKELCYQNSWDNPSCFNGYYATSFHSWIYYNSKTPLLVKSDDDSWTFINDHLAADIGGTHGDWYGVVDTKLSAYASQLELTKEDTFYTYDMYYAERGASIAGLTFVISPQPACSHFNITGCCDDSIDSDKDGISDCYDGCPEDPNRYGPGSCECNAPPDCNETKHCALYTAANCGNTTWSADNCGVCGNYCVSKSEAAACPCSSYTTEASCTSNPACTFCKTGKVCADKNKCLCANADKNQCSSEAQSLTGGKCNFCYNSVCQDPACKSCPELAFNDPYCESSNCFVCKEENGYVNACKTKVEECEQKCDAPYYQGSNIVNCKGKCKNCGNGLCIDSTTSSCPTCNSYSDPTKCNNAPGCSYCSTMQKCLKSDEKCYTCEMETLDQCGKPEFAKNCIKCTTTNKCYTNVDGFQCPTCETITSQNECTNDGSGSCKWCATVNLCLSKSVNCACNNQLANCEHGNGCELCGPNICSDKNTCQECSQFTTNGECKMHFVKSSSTICTYCGNGQCADSKGFCNDCESFDTKDKCLDSINDCYWCGSSCKSSKSKCPPCSYFDTTKDKCDKSQDADGNSCFYCGNIQNPLEPTKCAISSSECDLKCGQITDGNLCVKNCMWCGSNCVEKSAGCPQCGSYNATQETYNQANDVCIKSFEIDSDGLIAKCQRCEDDLSCMPATGSCWVNCTRIETETLCKSKLDCTWCGNGLCAFKKNAPNYPECPACNSYITEESCHKSIRSCSWCNGSCKPRADCIAAVVTTAATIGAGIIAAIAVGAAIFVGISVYGSKKVYDAILQANEASMDTANSNDLYKSKGNGGDNPLFDK